MAVGSIGNGSYNQLSMQQGINFQSQSTMIDTGSKGSGGGITIVNQNISIEINQSIDINQVFGGSAMRMGIAEDLKSMSIGQLEKETMDSIKELLDSQKLEDIKKQLELFKKLLEIQKEMLEAILKMMGAFAGGEPEQGKVNMEDLEQMAQSGRGKIKATEKGLTEVYEKIQEAAENEAKKEEALKNQAKGQDVNAENNNDKGDSKKISSSDIGNMRYQASADSAEMLSMVGGGGGAVGGAGGAEGGGASGGGASSGGSGGGGSAS